MKAGRKVWSLVAVLGVALLASPLVVRVVNRPKARFPYDLRPMTAAEYEELASKPGWQKSSAPVAPGVALNGLVRRPKAPHAPWILFFPGNDATQLKTAQKFLDKVLEGRDWGAAVYAYRGYDSSPGAPDREAYRADATALLDGLREREKLDPKQVHIVAFSLGGWLASAAAQTAARAGKPVASLNLLAAVQYIEMVHRGWAAGYAFGDVYATEPLLDDVPAPILVMIGANDEALGVEQGRKLAAKVGARGRYVELPNAGHVNLMDQPETALEVQRSIDAASAAVK